MVRCTFCSKQIPQGTGKLYVKKDGKRFDFCSNKCEKNMLKLKRKSQNYKWTQQKKQGDQ